MHKQVLPVDEIRRGLNAIRQPGNAVEVEPKPARREGGRPREPRLHRDLGLHRSERRNAVEAPREFQRPRVKVINRAAKKIRVDRHPVNQVGGSLHHKGRSAPALRAKMEAALGIRRQRGQGGRQVAPGRRRVAGCVGAIPDHDLRDPAIELAQGKRNRAVAAPVGQVAAGFAPNLHTVHLDDVGVLIKRQAELVPVPEGQRVGEHRAVEEDLTVRLDVGDFFPLVQFHGHGDVPRPAQRQQRGRGDGESFEIGDKEPRLDGDALCPARSVERRIRDRYLNAVAEAIHVQGHGIEQGRTERGEIGLLLRGV